MLRTADKRLFVGTRLQDDFGLLPSVVAPAASIGSTSLFALCPGPSSAASGSSAWPAANRALFIPFRIPAPVVVTGIVVGAGSGAGGNFDVGIYTAAGAKIVSSGSTARSASTELVVDIADTFLQPGLYFMAMSADGTNAYTTHGGPIGSANQWKMWGARQMASAFPLPSTATFATVASANMPVMNLLLSPVESKSRLPRFPPAVVITPYHVDSVGLQLRGNNFTSNTVTSLAPGANRVLYYPFRLYEPARAQKMAIAVGTVQNGNVDVGIYTAGGTRLVNSGSTALGAINTFQEFDITDTPLGPGLYWLAITFSGTGTIYGSTAGDEIGLPTSALYEETTGGFGLPATAAMALSTAASPEVGVIVGVWFDSLI